MRTRRNACFHGWRAFASRVDMFLVPRFILDHPWLFGVAVLLSLVGIFHLGRALGKSRGLSGDSGVGLIDGAIFALVGLLLAFTFTSAAAGPVGVRVKTLSCSSVVRVVGMTTVCEHGVWNAIVLAVYPMGLRIWPVAFHR